MAVPREGLGERIRQDAGGTEAASSISDETPAPARDSALDDATSRDPRLFRARGTYRPWYVRETGPLGRGRRD